jgi:hypothetical protein
LTLLRIPKALFCDTLVPANSAKYLSDFANSHKELKHTSRLEISSTDAPGGFHMKEITNPFLYTKNRRDPNPRLARIGN